MALDGRGLGHDDHLGLVDLVHGRVHLVAAAGLQFTGFLAQRAGSAAAVGEAVIAWLRTEQKRKKKISTRYFRKMLPRCLLERVMSFYLRCELERLADGSSIG